MKVVTIESKAYQDLVKRIENIANYIASKDNSQEETEVWLDSNEVADLLHISIRTLQRLRKEKLINYTMLRGKCLYRLSDLEKSLQERIIPTDQKTLADLRKKYIVQGIKIGQ